MGCAEVTGFFHLSARNWEIQMERDLILSCMKATLWPTSLYIWHTTRLVGDIRRIRQTSALEVSTLSYSHSENNLFVNSDWITDVSGRILSSIAPCGHSSGSQPDRKACRPDRPSTNEARRYVHLGLSYLSSKEVQESTFIEDSQPAPASWGQLATSSTSTARQPE